MYIFSIIMCLCLSVPLLSMYVYAYNEKQYEAIKRRYSTRKWSIK